MELNGIPFGPEGFNKAFGKKWGPRIFTGFFAIIVLALIAIAFSQIGGFAAKVQRYVRTGTTADGSKKHPYPDSRMCPPGSDVFMYNFFDQDGTVLKARPGRPTCYVNNVTSRSPGPLIDKSGQ